MSGGSLRRRKLNFDDVTIEHDCVLPEPPNDVLGSHTFMRFLLSLIVISKKNPKTKKHFKSSDAVYSEITRHMCSNYWYIIHPYSELEFYWSSLMAFVHYLLFLHIPFAYAFYQDLLTQMWCTTIGTMLNTLCILDLFVNFFTGFETKNSNFIVLHHGSIIQNYLRASFWCNFLSALPFDAIYRLYFNQVHSHPFHGNVCDENRIKLLIAAFHFAFIIKFLRFASLGKMMRSLRNMMTSIKLSFVKTVIILLIFRTILFIHLYVCSYKAVTSGVVMYFEQKCSIGEHNKKWMDYTTFHDKYIYILDFVIWALFDTSFQESSAFCVSEKLITSICILIGVGYNIYLLIQILNIMNTIHAPRTKYYEVMNQLDAYMLKKQFSIHLQNRLRFFYKKRFQKSYYREHEIMGILSEPLQREIIVNTGQLFVERVQLFQVIPKSLVSQIAGSCSKEQFLPNDLIVKAGSFGECMFFIASGSVCVTTTNGKELCHLVDGDHFGEVALILKTKKRIATVTAIEFSEIYVLDYASFKRYLQINEAIMKELTKTANIRIKLTLLAEEEHKNQLHAKIARD